MKNIKDDPFIRAEVALLEFTETVCEIWGQYKGKYKIYYYILEFIADKLLWRE